MRLILDTATFVWALRSPELVSRRAMAALNEASANWELSSLSISELAINQSCGKLDLGEAEVSEGLLDLRIRVLSWTAEHAWKMFGLPLRHKDPFDRQIIAQALVEGIPIVTPDRAFRAYKGVEVIW